MRIGPVFLVFTLASLAFGQDGAERAAPATATPPPARSGALEDFLDLVGPVPAAEKPHVERFHEFALDIVGPVPLIGEALGAGLSQWTNSPKEWGQGWGAFGKRYWSNLAYNGIRQGFSYGGSLALREDTRYFSSSRDGAWGRTRHALVSTFTARTMDGRDRFSISNTGGVIAAAGFSSLWGPDSWKGAGNIAENAGLSFASTAVTNVIREFLPDILGRRRRK